jgi:hypothetical protein
MNAATGLECSVLACESVAQTFTDPLLAEVPVR